jgi:hypothetical protein
MKKVIKFSQLKVGDKFEFEGLAGEGTYIKISATHYVSRSTDDTYEARPGETIVVSQDYGLERK